jgi:hypothetical protein
MKKLFNVLVIPAALIFFILSCDDFNEVNAPPLDTGSADFSRFVSIGNSLTMAEQSSSVFESSQMYSFGKMIADKVGTTYAQAIFSNPGTGGRIEIADLNPFTTYTNQNQGNPTNLNYPAPYNNLGIKGAFLTDVLNATDANTCYTANFGAPNPLFDAVLRGLGTQLELAIAQQPTFVTLWIGNNDILAFATRGGLFPVTSPNAFAQNFGIIVDSIAATGAEVVMANIPNVKAIPFFTTVGPGIGLAIQNIQGVQEFSFTEKTMKMMSD